MRRPSVFGCMRLEIHPEDLDDDPDLHRTIRISKDGLIFADCGD